MESLCLVKSHEITRVTAGMYSTAEQETERERETERVVVQLYIRLDFSGYFLCLWSIWELKGMNLFR